MQHSSPEAVIWDVDGYLAVRASFGMLLMQTQVNTKFKHVEGVTYFKFECT